MEALHDAGPLAIVTRPHEPHDAAMTPMFLQLMLLALLALPGLPAPGGGIESNGRALGFHAPGRLR